MKQISTKICLICALFSFGQASAQSLPELINIALEKNYQISIVKNEAEIGDNNNVIGATGALPSAEIAGSYSNSYNNTQQDFADGTIREGDNARNTNTFAAATANWTIFNGFRVYAMRDQLGYLQELGHLNTKFYIEQTVSDIVTAYYQLIYENQLLRNYEQSLKISKFRLDIETKRKQVGAGNAIDYGQALVDYQTDSMRCLGQTNAIQTLKVDLNNVLSNPLEQEVTISEDDINIIILPNKDSIQQKVIEANTLLAEQQLQELIAETDLRISKANRYPKVDLFGGYQYSKSTAAVGFVNSNQSYGPTFGVSVSFNLFNGGATNRDIKNTAIYSENAKLTKEQVTLRIDADVINYYNQYLSVTQRVAIAESNVKEMTKVYKTAEAQLKQGAINGYDFRLTQLTLLNSELTLMNLRFTLKSIEINLNRMSGRVVTAYM